MVGGMVHPYFIDRARNLFAAAGGNAAAAMPLAAWAEANRHTELAGVIVSEDGTILAETVTSALDPAVTVLTRASQEAWIRHQPGVVSEVGAAMSAMRRHLGIGVIHLTRSALTRGRRG